jgi:hypothetical protein
VTTGYNPGWVDLLACAAVQHRDIDCAAGHVRPNLRRERC